MCDNGRATIIRWAVDPAVMPPHNMHPVWCNGACIQTPSGQPSPAVVSEATQGDPHD